MSKTVLLLSAALFALAILPVAGQDTPAATRRTVERTVMFGYGGANVLDTYLAQSAYTGQSVSMALHTERTMRRGKGLWTVQGFYELQGAWMKSLGKNRKAYDADIAVGTAFHYNFRPLTGLRIGVGPMASLTGGGTYVPKNSNNPAQGRAEIDFGASAIAAYDFRLWNIPWQAHTQVRIPLAGVMFSPAYGQSYYEIFTLGHYDHNVRATWVGNAPSFYWLTQLRFRLGYATLFAGYLCEVRQSHVNPLKRHRWTHQLSFGFVRNLHLIR